MPIIVDVVGDWEADALVTLTTVKRFLAVESPTADHSDPTAVDDTFLNILIGGCSKAFENYCQRTFTQTAYTEYHDGDKGGGSRLFRVKNPPIASSPTPELWDNTDYAWADADKYTLNEDWKFTPSSGIVELLYGYFTTGRQNIKISYTGGYSTIPDDVKMAVAMWVCELYKDSRDTRWGMTSKAHAEWTIAFTNDEIPRRVRFVADRYRIRTW